ncbi:ABC transporter ATP-binding protein [Modestobacter lapidis]|nr:ABC transporter ATP-binding protein [Modestobacter lapidis]
MTDKTSVVVAQVAGPAVEKGEEAVTTAARPAEPRSVKVRLEGVTRSYPGPDGGAVVALQDVDLAVREGEFVAIVGPSGCGKSTLLRLVAGLQETTSGTIDRHHSGSARPDTAMVFQDHALFPWRTVLRNVTFGLENRGTPKREAWEIAARELQKLGLTGFASAYPHQLSGGMKQRVGIARALASDAEILLMDEPLGALDAQTRTVLQDQILDLRKADPSLTCLYVTHAIDEAVFLADRIILMTARPGRVKEEVAVDLGAGRDSSVRGTAAFAKLAQDIWEHLRSEVEAAMQQESARSSP